MGLFDSIKDIVSPVADFIAPGFGSLVGGIGSFVGGQQTNKAQYKLAEMQNAATARNTDETNRWNYDIAARANDAARDNAREAMNFSRESAREAMSFSERMSNSAYQRVVSDMRAAGLNPLLGIDKGGSSSPGGVSAAGVAAPVTTARMEAPSVSRPSYESPIGRMAQQIGSGLSSALDWQRKDKELFEAELANRHAQATQTLASANNLNSDTANKRLANQVGNRTFDASVKAPYLQNEKTAADTALTTQQKINAQIDEIIRRYGVSSARAASARGDTDVKYDESDVGKILRAAKRLSDDAGGVVGNAKKILPRWLQ